MDERRRALRGTNSATNCAKPYIRTGGNRNLRLETLGGTMRNALSYESKVKTSEMRRGEVARSLLGPGPPMGCRSPTSGAFPFFLSAISFLFAIDGLIALKGTRPRSFPQLRYGTILTARHGALAVKQRRRDALIQTQLALNLGYRVLGPHGACGWLPERTSG